MRDRIILADACDVISQFLMKVKKVECKMHGAETLTPLGKVFKEHEKVTRMG